MASNAENREAKRANKAVNKDAFFVRAAHYKCACYGWRSAEGLSAIEASDGAHPLREHADRHGGRSAF